jgi:hypothetical protein
MNKRHAVATKTATCRRCRATLRSTKSVACGIGPVCERNERRERAAAAAGYKPHQVESAVELIEDGAIVAMPTPGLFVAVSTDGSEFYECTAESCGCKAAENGRQCYHRLAALIAA